MGELVEAAVVWTRDLTSGRLHERYRVRGRLVDDPRCNLEGSQAGSYREIDRAELTRLVEADARLACRWCFPALAEAGGEA